MSETIFISKITLTFSDYLVNPITGNALIKKHAKFALSSFEKATLLTSTRSRKHLAQISLLKFLK